MNKVQVKLLAQIEPNDKFIDTTVIVIDINKPQKTKDGQLREIRVADKSGSMSFVLFDDRSDLLRMADVLKIHKAYAQLYRGALTLYVPKSGYIQRIDTFCMLFSDTPNFSEVRPIEVVGVPATGIGGNVSSHHQESQPPQQPPPTTTLNTPQTSLLQSHNTYLPVNDPRRNSQAVQQQQQTPQFPPLTDPRRNAQGAQQQQQSQQPAPSIPISNSTPSPSVPVFNMRGLALMQQQQRGSAQVRGLFPTPSPAGLQQLMMGVVNGNNIMAARQRMPSTFQTNPLRKP